MGRYLIYSGVLDHDPRGKHQHVDQSNSLHSGPSPNGFIKRRMKPRRRSSPVRRTDERPRSRWRAYDSVLERHSIRVGLLEPRFRGIDCGQDLDVVDIADPFGGVHIEEDGD